ncbi:hypothetical protein Peur_036862 [Populus x canadensis]
MRTHLEPIRLFPSPLCTWPIRLHKPRTCDAYPSLHDTWPEDGRRWHLTLQEIQSSKRKAVYKRHLP